MQFGWDFNLAADFKTDNANTMVTQLRQKFVTWNNKLKGGLTSRNAFCVKPDCTDMVITVVNHKNNYRIKIDIDRVA